MTFFAEQTFNGVMLGLVYALFAVGFGLVIANMRIFHVAHEGVFTWGAVIFWLMAARLDAPLLVGVISSVLGCAVMNVIAYYTLIRHLVSRRGRELAGFISSLGGLLVLTELASLTLGNTTVAIPPGVFEARSWNVGGVRISSLELIVAVVSLASLTITYFLIEKSRFGRRVRTVAYDRELAGLLGVNAERVTVAVFGLSGALAGLAGALIALLFSVVDSTLGAAYLITAIAVIVLGGYGSILGVGLAGVAIGLTYSWSVGHVSSGYAYVIVYSFLVAFLLFRPTGFIRARQDGLRA